MNLRCYLRGLGIGIIVTAILMGLSTKPEEMSDAQIIAKAKQLGMIDGSATLAQEAEKQLEQLEQNKETEDSAEDGAEENTDEEVENPAENSEEENSKSALDEKLEEDLLGIRETGDEEEVTLDDVTDEESQPEGESEIELPKEDEQPKEDVQPETTPEAETSYTLEIRGGDTSVSVSRKLVEMGLVADAPEYDQYLCQNGFDKKICTGTYQINSGATYEEIAKIITKSNE